VPAEDKIRVVIVDDVEDTREYLTKLLHFESDIQVVGEAADGEEGIAIAQELRPDIVLMDINMPGRDGISATEAIRAQVPGTQVIMMSVQGEADYLRRSMLAGAREFLTKPFSIDELLNSVRRVHQLSRGEREAALSPVREVVPVPSASVEPTGRIFSVFSPKGGVGCSTVACNLAVALRSTTQKRVVLVDCNLQFGDVGILLNLQGGKTILDLVPHMEDLDREVISDVLIAHASGIKVLLAPPRPEMAELVTADHVKRILGELRESFDYVVVDLWPSFQETVLSVLDLSDQILVLLSLEMPAIKNVKLFLEVAEALGYPPDKVSLVLNRSDAVAGIKPGDVEAILRQPLWASIVTDTKLVPYAANQGVPFVISNRDSNVAKGITNLARMLSTRFDAQMAVGSENARARSGNPVSKLLGGIPLKRRPAAAEVHS